MTSLMTARLMLLKTRSGDMPEYAHAFVVGVVSVVAVVSVPWWFGWLVVGVADLLNLNY